MGELTRKQEAAMRHFAIEGECVEGSLHQLWPLIHRPRMVLNGLVAKGLLEFDCYWDEDTGYEMKLTDTGRAWIDAQRTVVGRPFEVAEDG